ncbi:sugar transferase [Raoultella scottii]|uniref:sugar transferase n=1 Tax=Raoultella scottii TaxID=3040937 RepID=UPI002F92CA66
MKHFMFSNVFYLCLLTLLALLLVPVVAISFIYFAIYDGHHPIYSQDRIGVNGKIFKIYKIRTMKINASDIFEKEIKTNKCLFNEYVKYAKIKTVKDPRIAGWLPYLLRKTSLDELPQIINILKGDMSFVGPRPYTPNETLKIEKNNLNEIVSVKPGLTGIWQIRGRNNASFRHRNRYDIFYVRKKNRTTDLWISLKTVNIVLKTSNTG